MKFDKMKFDKMKFDKMKFDKTNSIPIAVATASPHLHCTAPTHEVPVAQRSGSGCKCGAVAHCHIAADMGRPRRKIENSVCSVVKAYVSWRTAFMAARSRGAPDERLHRMCGDSVLSGQSDGFSERLNNIDTSSTGGVYCWAFLQVNTTELTLSL
jgi:hypothetical protein